MNDKQKKVIKAEYKPNCYILVSAFQRDDSFGNIRVEPFMSFLYDAGKFAAEWEPKHGPIQVWEKCKSNHSKAKEHYYYDYIIESWGNFSQLAVDENKLPSAFLNGEYDYIFSVLKGWAKE